MKERQMVIGRVIQDFEQALEVIQAAKNGNLNKCCARGGRDRI